MVIIKNIILLQKVKYYYFNSSIKCNFSEPDGYTILIIYKNSTFFLFDEVESLVEEKNGFFCRIVALWFNEMAHLRKTIAYRN